MSNTLSGTLRAFLGFIFLTFPVAAQSVAAPAFSLSARELLAIGKPANEKVDHDANVLLIENRLSFDQNGKLHHTYRSIYQVLTAQGGEEWGSSEERWEPWHEERPRIRARIVTADGVEHKLDPATISEASPPGTDSTIYSDVRQLRWPLPAIAPGSIVEEEIDRTSTPVLGADLTRIYMARGVPAKLSRLIIDYPDGLPLRYKAFLLPALKETKTSENGVTHVVLEASDMAAIRQAHAFLPGDTPRTPHVQISTGASWQALAQTYNQAVEKQLASAPIDKPKAAGSSNRADLINELIRELHRQVRYTGIEFGDAAIIPATPAETLKRKYGDCKDKSTLLVSMLRGAGIPAHIALLETGSSLDVADDQPGMGLFDHAIVHVPGAPELWIDATAEYLSAGSLPSADQGRKALIIAPETTGLTLIPEAPSSAKRTVQTREFFLPDYGKSRIIETFEGTSNAESELRERYGSADTEQIKKELSDYVRREFRTEKTAKISHPKADDFTQPFRLRLEIEEAGRGSVGPNDAAVGIQLADMFSDLPAEFREKPEKDAAPEDGLPKRTADYLIDEAYNYEIIYKIHLPPGYVTPSLPKSEKVNFGPTQLSSEFHYDNGLVTADYRFDTEKRRLTILEGEQIQKSLAEFLAQPMTLLNFEPLGSSLLSEGKVREAFKQFNSMMAEYPSRPIYPVQFSTALLSMGLGDAARKAAKKAAEADPKSAMAQANLGYVLLHDLIGRDFAIGFDWAGSEAALRKANELDANEMTSRRNLGVLLEHDSNGERYGSADRMKEAIQVYRGMGDKLEDNGLLGNLLFDLTYTNDFAGLRKETEKQRLTAQTFMFRLIATAKLDGLDAALKEYQATPLDEATKNTALTGAAGVLIRLREYPMATEVLKAAAKGNNDSATLLRRAEIFSRVKRQDLETRRLDTPEHALRSFMVDAIMKSNAKGLIRAYFAKEILVGIDEKQIERQEKNLTGAWKQMEKQLGLSHESFADLLVSLLEMKTDNNGKDGCRVRMIVPGGAGFSFYMTQEGPDYKFLGAGNGFEGVGRRALAALNQGDVETARRWLDLAREEVKIAGGDDPLDGPVFPRIWSKGMNPSPETMRLAIASLIGESEEGKDALPLLKAAIDSAQDQNQKMLAEIAYVSTAVKCNQAKEGEEYARALSTAHPESLHLTRLLSAVFSKLEKWTELDALVKQQLARDPDDPDNNRLLAESQYLQNKFVEAEGIYRKVAESGKGTTADWNQFGWVSLFAGDTTNEKASLVLRANSQTNSSHVLHTVAAMYADTDSAREAHQDLMNAAKDLNDAEVWLVLGRMAERFGMPDDARAAYEKVIASEGKAPLSSGALAELWLTKLKRE